MNLKRLLRGDRLRDSRIAGNKACRRHVDVQKRAGGLLNAIDDLAGLFGRVGLERDEVNILRGILSSTQTHTGHGRKGGLS